MKRRCAWCSKDMGEKEPLDDSRVTDGICDECYAKSVREMLKPMMNTLAGPWIDEKEANARLISAAPDLLEACKNLRQWILDGCPAPVNIGEPLLKIADAAIAKAEGNKE